MPPPVAQAYRLRRQGATAVRAGGRAVNHGGVDLVAGQQFPVLPVMARLRPAWAASGWLYGTWWGTGRILRRRPGGGAGVLPQPRFQICQPGLQHGHPLRKAAFSASRKARDACTSGDNADRSTSGRRGLSITSGSHPLSALQSRPQHWGPERLPVISMNYAVVTRAVAVACSSRCCLQCLPKET